MSDEARFFSENATDIARLAGDPRTAALTRSWFDHVSRYKYSYHFTWLGRPIIQFPQDMVALQEIIWSVQPDLIIETGIARGGSLIFFASILELIGGAGEVLGIDIDIRSHNREAVESHRMFKRISMIEGSSIAPEVVERAKAAARGKSRVMVVLDSMHTHDHVRAELELYAPLVRAGSYLVVMDTVVEDMPEAAFPDRPWGRGNNPKTAVRDFLAANRRFVVDRTIQDKLQVTVAPEGYLRCVRD